jgi:hypothetical protein
MPEIVIKISTTVENVLEAGRKQGRDDLTEEDVLGNLYVHVDAEEGTITIDDENAGTGPTDVDLHGIDMKVLTTTMLWIQHMRVRALGTTDPEGHTIPRVELELF